MGNATTRVTRQDFWQDCKWGTRINDSNLLTFSGDYLLPLEPRRIIALRFRGSIDINSLSQNEALIKNTFQQNLPQILRTTHDIDEINSQLSKYWQVTTTIHQISVLEILDSWLPHKNYPKTVRKLKLKERRRKKRQRESPEKVKEKEKKFYKLKRSKHVNLLPSVPEEPLLLVTA